MTAVGTKFYPSAPYTPPVHPNWEIAPLEPYMGSTHVRVRGARGDAHGCNIVAYAMCPSVPVNLLTQYPSHQAVFSRRSGCLATTHLREWTVDDPGGA